MRSPSKHSPLDTIHCPTSVSIAGSTLGIPLPLSLSAANVISLLIIVTSPKCRPCSTWGTRKNCRGLNPASKGDVQTRWWNCGPKTQAQLIQSAWGIVVLENPSPPLPQIWSTQFTRSLRHFKTSSRKPRWHFQPKARILGAQFHGSQKKPPTCFDFWFAFSWLFRSQQIFRFPLSALWLQLDVILVDPQFIACDDPFQEFIAFLWGFPVKAALFPSHILLRTE